MKRNNKGGANATPTTTDTKVVQEKGIDKVLQYFRYTTGTTLDCAIATEILRNSITYYVVELENLGLLKDVRKAPDCNTGRMAKHYSANPEEWQHIKQKCVQLELFGKEVCDEL